MTKFCKVLLIFLAVTTILPFVLAFFSLIAIALALIFGSSGALSAVVLALIGIAIVLIPGTLIVLMGAILGWIGGFIGKILLSVISVVLIAVGVAVWFVSFLPPVSLIAFAVVLVIGLVCCKKQKGHSSSEREK